MSAPVGKNVAEERFVERLSPARAISLERKGERHEMSYPREPYHNETRKQFARRLSRMDRSARLAAKAIRRTLKEGKPEWERKWVSMDETLTLTWVETDDSLVVRQLSSRKWEEWR